jgi:APA family basic amino acid/polyamine antiporter
MNMDSDRTPLLRVLGLGFGLAVVVGGVVGQGILRAPGLVASALPGERLILACWLGGGLLATITALPLVELASAIPRAGGPYVFAARAFGPLAGTLTGWTDWLNGVVAIGFFSVVLAEFVHRLGRLEFAPVAALAVGFVALVTLINWSGTRTAGSSQAIGSALKGIGLLLLVALLLLAPGRAHTVATPPLVHGGITLAAVALALRTVQNTYAGWNVPAYFGEEIRSPERDVARAVFAGIALITVLYLTVNVALLHVLSPAQMAASTLPAADAAGIALGPRGDLIVNCLSLISVFAIANLYTMFLSRVCYAMAHNGALPAVLATVSRGGTPRVAVAAGAVVAAVMAASGSYEHLIAIAAPLSILVDILVAAAAIRLRASEPALPRPFRMPLSPLPAIGAMLMNGLLLAVLIHEDPRNSLTGLTALALVGTVYLVRLKLSRGAGGISRRGP